MHHFTVHQKRPSFEIPHAIEGFKKEYPWMEDIVIKKTQKGFSVHARATEGASYPPLPIYWDPQEDGSFFSWGYTLRIDGYAPERRPAVKITFCTQPFVKYRPMYQAQCYDLPFDVRAGWFDEAMDSLKEWLYDYKKQEKIYMKTHPDWVRPEWDILLPYE